MTKKIIQIPEGFTSAAIEPTGGDWTRFTVLYAPHDRDTRFEMGTARYSSTSNPKYRWKTVDGDNVGDSGRAVFAWRRDVSPEVVRIAAPEPVRVQPSDQAHYDQAVAILADHHRQLVEEGRGDEKPEGFAMIVRLMGVPAEQVERDYLAEADKAAR